MMGMYESLLGDKEKLDDLYRKELCAVLDLQSVLLDQIIPDMVSDLGMNESSRHYTEEWAKDTREYMELWLSGG